MPKGDRSGRARSDWTAPRLQLLNPKSQSGGARERARGTAVAAAGGGGGARAAAARLSGKERAQEAGRLLCWNRSG